MTRHAIPVCLLSGLILGLALCAPGARAERVRLDDTLTHVVPPNARMDWLPLSSASGPADMAMEAWVGVQVRLDTRAWAGRQGRIYLVLPRDESSTLEASWTGTGRLQDGTVRSGERALVFSGAVPGPWLEEQWRMRLRSPADWAASSRRLQFHFEIESP